MRGLADGLNDSWSEMGSPLWETIDLDEGVQGLFWRDLDRLGREGFLSETPTSHDTWMEAAGLLE